MLGALFLYLMVAMSGLLTATCFGMLFRALATGKATVNWQAIYRRRYPIRYWLSVGGMLILCGLFARWFVGMLIIALGKS